MVGVVKSAIGDMVMTFSWVVLSATFGLQTGAIVSAGGFQGITWAPLAITTFLIFVYVSIFTIIFGGASFNPTGSAAFYAAGIPGDTLFSLAIRLPAQVYYLRSQTFRNFLDSESEVWICTYSPTLLLCVYFVLQILSMRI